MKSRTFSAEPAFLSQPVLGMRRWVPSLPLPETRRDATTHALQSISVCAHSNNVGITTITLPEIRLICFLKKNNGRYFQSSFIFVHGKGKLWITSTQKNRKQLAYTHQHLIFILIYTFRKVISEYQTNPPTLVCSPAILLYAQSAILGTILILAVGFWVRIHS